jgi:hypothetical protein
VKDGRFGFHTGREENPWWEVDLLGVYDLEEIVIFNRMGDAAQRADDLRILVSLDREDWRVLPEWSGGRFGGIDGLPCRVRPNGVAARFVRLQIFGLGVLHLDEVEVYGHLQQGTERNDDIYALLAADSFQF